MDFADLTQIAPMPGTAATQETLLWIPSAILGALAATTLVLVVAAMLETRLVACKYR